MRVVRGSPWSGRIEQQPAGRLHGFAERLLPTRVPKALKVLPSIE